MLPPTSSGSLIKTFFFICVFILLRGCACHARVTISSWPVGWKVTVASGPAESSLTGARAAGSLNRGEVGDAQRSSNIWNVFLASLRTSAMTIQYPEEKPYLPPRYRGRIILSRDPDGEERCVACNLCAVACPVDCISLQKTEDDHGRWYPGILPHQLLALHLLRLCAKRPVRPTQSSSRRISRLGEYDRQNLVYEKEDLLISGTGKYPEYNFYRIAGLAIAGKTRARPPTRRAPVDVKDLMP